MKTYPSGSRDRQDVGAGRVRGRESSEVQVIEADGLSGGEGGADLLGGQELQGRPQREHPQVDLLRGGGHAANTRGQHCPHHTRPFFSLLC
jgi:hypothetical protein